MDPRWKDLQANAKQSLDKGETVLVVLDVIVWAIVVVCLTIILALVCIQRRRTPRGPRGLRYTRRTPPQPRGLAPAPGGGEIELGHTM